MAHTYFQEFKRDDGSPVTVEYSITEGSPASYSPMHGAEGGDPCEVEIVKAFTEANDDVKLTDHESELFCDWIAAQHEFDYERLDDDVI